MDKRVEELLKHFYNRIEDRVMTKTLHTSGQIDELVKELLAFPNLALVKEKELPKLVYIWHRESIIPLAKAMREVSVEAKDTITKTTVYNCHNTLEERLLEQAEISFEAGKQEGRREVVKVINDILELPYITREVSVEAVENIKAELEYKCKEWGISDD